MKHLYNIDVIKKDGTPYTVNRILHHPACKWVLSERNHQWHVSYLLNLLQLFPTHSCAKSVTDALSKTPTSKLHEAPTEYLCLTNSDMSGLETATVFEKYRRHLENKHKGAAL